MEQETIQQGDRKDVFLKPPSDYDTTHVCDRELKGELGKCKGFITTRKVRYFRDRAIYPKSYCSNALCDFGIDKSMRAF